MNDCLASSENNEALNKILHEAVQPLALAMILGNCLDILLSLSWLSVLPKAGIFTSNQSLDELELISERNLGEQITTLCAKVAFGYCLCGRAAATKQTQQASCIDERHEVMFEGIAPHGHYNIPILSGDRVMGVIVLYLPHGAEHKESEIQFLESVADTLAMVIMLHQQADELKAYTHKLVSHTQELDFQKRALDEHAIVSITNAQGEITYVNDKFCNVSGYRRSELMGQSHNHVSSDQHPPEFFTALWKTILAGQVWKGEIINRNKSGDLYWLDATIVPTLNDEGKLFQYVDISTETTHVVKIESELRESRNHFEQEFINRTEDLRQALKAEQEYNTMQKQFLTMASHEFRTPLSIIDMTAQRLLKRHDTMTDEQKVERFAKIRKAAQRITGLIESTLSSAKVEEGKLMYTPIQCDLKSILNDCIQTQREITSRYDIKTDLAELPDQLLADPGHLAQIFTNLLSNAVKYSPGHKQVDVKGWSENGYVFVTVEDHGIGIPKDEMPKMFNRFFRTSTAAGIPGTGIGLNLVQKLLEMQGGNISFKSREGEGSIFKVAFPLTSIRNEALDG
ncbi:MAG: hypothetical protein COB59_07630 [Rhodospirillaceae bacterium]|nr:MAG: hypothetical protein COB59_07630 [Rhodospirillaceae bacterium]